METKTWTRGDGQKEDVEVGSVQKKELIEKLYKAGLWEADDPNRPDNCIPVEELEKCKKGGQMVCQKVGYKTKKEAATAINRIRKSHNRMEKFPHRMYWHSECGEWHLSSKEDGVSNRVRPITLKLAKRFKKLIEKR